MWMPWTALDSSKCLCSGNRTKPLISSLCLEVICKMEMTNYCKVFLQKLMFLKFSDSSVFKVTNTYKESNNSFFSA